MLELHRVPGTSSMVIRMTFQIKVITKTSIPRQTKTTLRVLTMPTRTLTIKRAKILQARPTIVVRRFRPQLHRSFRGAVKNVPTEEALIPVVIPATAVIAVVPVITGVGLQTATTEVRTLYPRMTRTTLSSRHRSTKISCPL